MSELTAILQKRLSKHDAEFIHYNQTWYSTDRFREDVLRVQRVLADEEVPVGARIVLADGNSYAFLVVYVSLLTAGMTIIPLNPQMPAPEMRKVFARSAAVGAIVDPSLETAFLSAPAEPDALGADTLAARCRVLLSVHDETDSIHLHRLRGSTAQASSVDPAPSSTIADRPTIVPQIPETAGAILLFTSGTTGAPKGVELNHKQVMATIHHIADSHHLTERDVSYCFLPLFHINAQVIAFLATMYTGGKLIVQEKFSASRFWPTIGEFGVTWVSAVPTVIAILTKSVEAPRVPTTLRFVRSASAPLPAFQAHRFEALFGVPVIESYGMTEAASQICVNPIPPGKHKIGSVGLPYGIDLEIMDAEGNPVPIGEIGEIAIRGDSVIERYAYGDEGGKSFLNGWFRTGDVGYVDADGYVFITGRSKEMINRAGQKISPREVEEVIGKHHAVVSVAVIGLPDSVYGERVVAYVIPEGGAGSVTNHADAFRAELAQLCKGYLSAYKCPTEFMFVDEIPVGPTGKIQRSRLRAQVMAAGIR